MYNNLFKVGDYIDKFNVSTGQQLPCGPIYQSFGLETHIKKHHPENGDYLLSYIPHVIKSPDYIGKHPKEADSIELVKKTGENVMVCIKLDSKNGYLYVASVFEIKESKLNNRLNSGRLKKY